MEAWLPHSASGKNGRTYKDMGGFSSGRYWTLAVYLIVRSESVTPATGDNTCL